MFRDLPNSSNEDTFDKRAFEKRREEIKGYFLEMHFGVPIYVRKNEFPGAVLREVDDESLPFGRVDDSGDDDGDDDV